MHRNSQWEDEVIDLENQVTHLLKKLEAVQEFFNEMHHNYMNSRTTPLVSNYIPKLREVLEAEP